MTLANPAILAVLMIVTAGTNALSPWNQQTSIHGTSASDTRWHPLEQPRRLAFDRTDGSSFDESVNAWSRLGLRGDFGICPWDALPSRTMVETIARLMSRDDAEHWVDYGWIVLAIAEDAERAEYAFKEALERDPTLQERIDVARAEAASHAADRAEAAQHREDARLSFVTPEAQPWPSTPWPSIAPMDISRMNRDARTRLDDIIRAGGMRDAVIETEHFLFATDFEESEPILRLSGAMEEAVVKLDEVLRRPQSIEVFPVKVMVILTAERDRFLLLESQLFDHLPDDDVHARCHCDGRFITIVIHESELEHETLFDAVRQVSFAYLHGYGSPVRLPAWANEGLATWIAVELDRRSIPAERLRRESIRVVRTDSDAATRILELEYGDEAFPSLEDHVGSLGYLLIDLMEFRQRGNITSYVRNIKQGRTPREALRNALGLTWPRFLQDVEAHYRVNN